MNKQKEVTIYDLETRLEKALKTIDEDYNTKLDDDKRREAMLEIVNNLVPTYNYDLLTVAGSNLWLGVEETEEGSKNAFACLREAIYRHLYGKAIEIMKI